MIPIQSKCLRSRVKIIESRNITTVLLTVYIFPCFVLEDVAESMLKSGCTQCYEIEWLEIGHYRMVSRIVHITIGY